jgi:hypothetical protein
MLVTLTNDFHNTSIRVRLGHITERNANRVRNNLCGMDDCTCSTSELGTRGKQQHNSQEILIENGDRIGVDLTLE